MTQIAQGAHVYLFPEPGQVYRVQADDVATVQVLYGAPSAVITLTAQSQTFGPYDSPAKLKVTANTASAEYTLIRAHYAELTPEQIEGGAVGVLGSNNAGGVVEPDGDVPTLGGDVTLPAMQSGFDGGLAPQKAAFQDSIAGDRVKSGATPGDIATPAGVANWTPNMFRLRQYAGDAGIPETGALVVGYAPFDPATIGSGSVVINMYGGTQGSRLPGTRDLRAIYGGYDCEITGGGSTGGGGTGMGGQACAIFASHHSGIYGNATHGVIAGGSYLTITNGDYNSIGGGNTNAISGGGSNCRIGGGRLNTITTAAGEGNATIGGGYQCSITARHATIPGGYQITVSGIAACGAGGATNTVSGDYAGALAGASNTAAAPYCGIVGGQSHVITGGSSRGDYVGIVGGLQHTAGDVSSTRFSAFVGGRQNKINGELSVAVGGRECVATGEAIMVSGYGAVMAVAGGAARAGGYFATAGDAQVEDYVARRQSTDATPIEARAGSTLGARLGVLTNSSYLYTVRVVAKHAANADCAGWEIKGVLLRTGAGTTLPFAGTKTVLGKTAGATNWDCAVNADNPNACIQVMFTGEAAKTINWVAHVQLVKVTA